jgi:antitoxin MazE
MVSKIISVNRWGNGLGIRLPKEFIDKAGITETSRVEVVETDGRLIIMRSIKSRKHIPLAERLKDWNGVPSEPEDIDWGEPVGEEEW